MTNNFENYSTETIADKRALSSVHNNPRAKWEVEMRRHEQVEDAKILTNVNWQGKVKTSEDFRPYQDRFIKMLWELEPYATAT